MAWMPDNMVARVTTAETAAAVVKTFAVAVAADDKNSRKYLVELHIKQRGSGTND